MSTKRGDLVGGASLVLFIPKIWKKQEKYVPLRSISERRKWKVQRL